MKIQVSVHFINGEQHIQIIKDMVGFFLRISIHEFIHELGKLQRNIPAELLLLGPISEEVIDFINNNKNDIIHSQLSNKL